MARFFPHAVGTLLITLAVASTFVLVSENTLMNHSASVYHLR